MTWEQGLQVLCSSKQEQENVSGIWRLYEQIHRPLGLLKRAFIGLGPGRLNVPLVSHHTSGGPWLHTTALFLTLTYDPSTQDVFSFCFQPISGIRTVVI